MLPSRVLSRTPPPHPPTADCTDLHVCRVTPTVFGPAFFFFRLPHFALTNSPLPRRSHEKMWLSNYWRITIIYVCQRVLPLAFVPRLQMNPAQLSHFVSLHDCSLALSTPVASPLLAGSPSGSHHCISSPGNDSVSESPGSAGSTPNDVI